MNDLGRALERFNRKERNLLIRRALDHSLDTPVHLGKKFRADVAKKLGISNIPCDAWWATDYHINWLVGAVALYLGGEDAIGRLNCQCRHSEKTQHLVEVSQQDIDLVITSDHHIILAEAKAYGRWDKEQMDSKIVRLNLLYKYYENENENEPRDGSKRLIQFHLLLIARTSNSWPDCGWPNWTNKKGKPPILCLGLGDTKPLTVTQSRKGGAKPGDWRVDKFC